MEYIKKADLNFYGIDDELKSNENSIYTTRTNTDRPVLTYTTQTLTTNTNNINYEPNSTTFANYNYDTSVNVEPTQNNLSFGLGQIDLTSIDANKYTTYKNIFKNNPPFGVYSAEDWRGTTLFDISGNFRNATTAGNINKITDSGNGASAPITFLTGGPSDTITWTTGSIPTNFTILSLTRYAGGNTQRILQSTTGNFVHGHIDTTGSGTQPARGVCFYGDSYKTSQTSKGSLYDWLTCIGKNDTRATGFINNILIDGIASATATGGTGNNTLTINNSSSITTQDSDFVFSFLMIWDRHLSDANMVSLNNLINDYKNGLINPRVFFPYAADYGYPILKTIDGIPINPLVWYKFDGSGTSMLLDSSGNNQHATNSGSTFNNVSFRKGDGSIEFASGNFLDIPRNYNLKTIITTNGLSFGGWVYINSSTAIVSCVFCFGDANHFVLVMSKTATAIFRFQINEAVYDTNNIVYDRWQHWYFTISTIGVCNFYINGIFEGGFTRLVGNFVLANSQYRLGSYTATASINNFIGLQDDFRIYDRVLTPEQISILYNNRYIDKSYPILRRNNVILNPLVWYRFDNPSNLGLDTIGNHNLTNNNSVGFNVDSIKGGGSGLFQSANSRFLSGTTSSFQNKSFTISCWIRLVLKTGTNSNYQIISIGGDNNANNSIVLLSFVPSFNRWYIAYYGSDTFSSVFTDEYDKWVHIAFTYRFSNGADKITRIYRNGIDITDGGSTRAANFNGNTNISISKYLTEYHNGLIDDLRIYEQELTATEILELYNGRVELITTKTTKPLNSIVSKTTIAMSGANNSVNSVVNNSSYSYITFNNSGTLNITKPLVCDILVIGGGGGGAGRHGGGGGAGALIYEISQLLNTGTYTITIGGGGAAGLQASDSLGTNGGDSEIVLSGSVIYRAKGGGGGRGWTNSANGADGGSGGGSTGSDPNTNNGGNAVSTNIINGIGGFTRGNKGGKNTGVVLGSEWSGGGGAGAGEVGQNTLKDGVNTNAGRGGNGLQIPITGTPTYYAGGGGGGLSSISNGSVGSGGLGGGGAGSKGAETATAGLPNTGGGGGGGGLQTSPNGSGAGSNGGSGVVIIRFKNEDTDKIYYWNDSLVDGVSYLSQSFPSNFVRKNTKKYKFTLDNSFKNLKLTSRAKLAISSISLPNIVSKSFLQSKAINNIILKMKGLNNNYIYDSTTKGTGSSVIFGCPIHFNSQGYGLTYDADNLPILVSDDQFTRLNTNNNGILFINQNPNYLYNFNINQSFIENEELEFEIIYDVSDTLINQDTNNTFIYKPQTLDFETDKDILESFYISFIIKDYEDGEEKVYNQKNLLNTINKNIYKDNNI